MSRVREDLFEQFEPEAAHSERAHGSNGVRLVSRVQQAVQDETVPPDTSVVDARYPETEELPVVSDADTDATTTTTTTTAIVGRPSVRRSAAIATAIFGSGEMVRRRGQTVIETRVSCIVDRSKDHARDTCASLGPRK